MALFTTLAILLTLAAVFAYINHLYIRLPTTIGVMLIALLFSLVLVLLEPLGIPFELQAMAMLERIDFSDTLLKGMLSFLLFAGALHVNLNDLAKQGRVIGVLATVGVAVSTAITGFVVYGISGALGLQIPLLYCFLFGALISPTDPIAVMVLLKSAGIPKTLETKVAGESLFNDGVGVVLFLILFEVATGRAELTAGSIATLFVQEAIGGIVFGLGLGYIAFLMLRRVDRYTVEVLITLALVTGGYALASQLHISGPLAIVVAGLLVGNHGRMLAMSETTREHLDTFWELTDEILNAVLFVLIGLEVLVIPFETSGLVLALAAIPIVLAARATSVGLAISALRPFRSFMPGTLPVLTWAGLRGGISVALALALPAGAARDLLLPATYAVVIVSIVVQGLTVKRLVRRVVPDAV
jgi:CPA1 family monovalent cation:H+ antiporter